jgi:hypothetical protein
MTIALPLPGEVISYSYLWADEHEAGQEEGGEIPFVQGTIQREPQVLARGNRMAASAPPFAGGSQANLPRISCTSVTGTRPGNDAGGEGLRQRMLLPAEGQRISMIICLSASAWRGFGSLRKWRKRSGRSEGT